MIHVAEWRSGYGLSIMIRTSQIQLRATTHAADSSFLSSIHRPSCYTRVHQINLIFLFLMLKSVLFAAHAGVLTR